MELIESRSCFVIWEEFHLVSPEEVDWAHGAVNSTTCEFHPLKLDPSLSWLVKTFEEITCTWIQVVVKASLQEGIILLALKDVMIYPLLKQISLYPKVLDRFCEDEGN